MLKIFKHARAVLGFTFSQKLLNIHKCFQAAFEDFYTYSSFTYSKLFRGFMILTKKDYLRESSFNMTRGYKDIETRSSKF